MSDANVNVGLMKYGHLYRFANPFNSPVVEQQRGVMERLEDDYQMPSSSICLSQTPICISLPSRYLTFLRVLKSYSDDVFF